MLSDEEKEAIEFFEKSFKKKIPPYWYDDTISNIEEKIKVILNLIEKRQKEIEELKEKNRQSKMRIVQLENEITARIEDVNKYFTPKDKIKAKIEEIEEILNGQLIEKLRVYFEAQKEVLQSLLEKE